MHDINVNHLKNVRNPDLQKEKIYNKLKKSFRGIQRRNLYLEESKEINQLDRIAKEKNKNRRAKSRPRGRPGS